MAIQALPTTRHTVPEVTQGVTAVADHTAAVLLPVQVAVVADQLSVPTRVAEDKV